MKLASFVLTAILALGLASASSSAPAAPSQEPVALLAQAQTPDAPSLDVTIDMHPDGHVAWYASPVWIAIFVLGGLVVLVLLAMAVRGGGGSSAPQGSTTVIK